MTSSNTLGSLPLYLDSLSINTQKAIITDKSMMAHRKSFSLDSSISSCYELPKLKSPKRKIISKALLIPQESARKNESSINLSKRQHKLQLDLDHHVLRAFVSLEDQKGSSNDNTLVTKGFNRMLKGMKTVRENKELDLEQEAHKFDIRIPQLKKRSDKLNAMEKLKSAANSI